MSSVEIMLCPVALVPGRTDELRVMAYRPKGEFPRAAMRSSAAETAKTLLARVATHSPSQLLAELEGVAFHTEGERATLIYTAVLPIVDVVHTVDGPPEGWVSLAPSPAAKHDPALLDGPDVDEEQKLVRNYWRRQLEETSAVFDFLPKYFTMAQVRSVYSSVWGEDQHSGSFHRWVQGPKDGESKSKKKSRPLVTEVTEKKVRGHLDRAFSDELERSEIGSQIPKGSAAGIARQLGALQGTVGLSGALVLATPLATILPAAVLAGGVAGATIAYQHQKKNSQGKKPVWFTRADEQRILLDLPYAPRPTWLTSREIPGRFH